MEEKSKYFSLSNWIQCAFKGLIQIWFQTRLIVHSNLDLISILSKNRNAKWNDLHSRNHFPRFESRSIHFGFFLGHECGKNRIVKPNVFVGAPHKSRGEGRICHVIAISHLLAIWELPPKLAIGAFNITYVRPWMSYYYLLRRRLLTFYHIL